MPCRRMPMGTDHTKHSGSDLMRIQHGFNGRVRESLTDMTSLEKFLEVVAPKFENTEVENE